jgi:hypothetical protein
MSITLRKENSGATMDLRADTKMHTARFAGLFAQPSLGRPVYDHLLLKTDGCVVAPTLGSIVPGWLLVIPRVRAINFSRFAEISAINPHELIQDVLHRLGVSNSRAIWFEHGPPEIGSLLGCGVDQAHLHIIIDPPFGLDAFEAQAREVSELEWAREPVASVYSTIKTGGSYLVAGSGGRAIIAEDVDRVGSQFFRRVVADLVAKPDCWNYKTHPFIENVRETLRTFGSTHV